MCHYTVNNTSREGWRNQQLCYTERHNKKNIAEGTYKTNPTHKTYKNIFSWNISNFITWSSRMSCASSLQWAQQESDLIRIPPDGMWLPKWWVDSCISSVSHQNGISQLHIIVEIYYSDPKPSICKHHTNMANPSIAMKRRWRRKRCRTDQ